MRKVPWKKALDEKNPSRLVHIFPAIPENRLADVPESDIETLEEYLNLQPLFELLRFVSLTDIDLHDVIKFLVETVEVPVNSKWLKFPRMVVLFHLWFRAFKQGALFSPSQMENRASIDLRFGKPEGFFAAVVDSVKVRSLLEAFMAGKVPDSFGTFDVFASIMKFAIQSKSVVDLLLQPPLKSWIDSKEQF